MAVPSLDAASFTNSSSSASAASTSNSSTSKSWQGRMPSKLARLVLVVSLFLIVFGAALPSWATPYTVITPADNGTGSLRTALGLAQNGDTINFDLGSSATITLTSGPLTISTNVTISGPGALSLAISGNNASTVFSVNGGVTAAISGLTIENGNSGVGEGGGINNGGTLTVSNSTLSGNTSASNAYGGGAIYNTGTLTVSNSTFSGNTTTSHSVGSGILNGGTVTVSNSTFSGNTSSVGGSGIYNEQNKTMTVSNSTFSGNSAVAIYNSGNLTLKSSLLAGQTSGSNCEGHVVPTSDGYNMDDDGSCSFNQTGDQSDVTNAKSFLGPLQNNGGPTSTIALLSGSSAIDAIPVTPVNECTDAFGNSVLTDQRGITRPQGSGCDIGAYELAAQVAASPASVSFGSVELCRTKKQMVTLQDDAASLVEIGLISLVDVSGNASDFSFRSYSTTGILGPKKGRSYQILVEFTPSQEIPESATLNIVTNAPGSPVQVQITGTGVKGPKGCDLNP
jgi:hypothetical protein